PKNAWSDRVPARGDAFTGIRLSRRRDIPFLRRIYRKSFGDGQKSEDLLFGELYGEDNCYVLTRFGFPAAMAFVLPVSVRGEGKEWHGCYLYAVATHPGQRGKGFGSRLISRIHADAEARGLDFALLVPATPELFGFYARLGYESAGRICRYEYVSFAPLTDRPEVIHISGDWYGMARERMLRGQIHLVWQEQLLMYQSKMLSLFGGGFCLLRENGADIGCAAISRAGGALDVQEILVPPGRLSASLAALAAHYGAGRVNVRLEAARGEGMGIQAQKLAAVCAPPAARAALQELYVALVMD
ncbi:MAG: GNAT family N-acetyltransferase, partial [Gracilibacteraceae bacterium]|nr:GNAT family N-acetyltransferase [Gracilibacteraceae bacterium]